MAKNVYHRFRSNKPDSPDATKVRPSNWNASHVDGNGNEIDFEQLDVQFIRIKDGAGSFFKLPVLTTAQRDALTPIDALLIFNSETVKIEKCVGGVWSALVSGGGGGGVSEFILLDDVPGSYAGNANKPVVVNGGATGLAFSGDHLVTDAQIANFHAPHSDDQDLSGYELKPVIFTVLAENCADPDNPYIFGTNGENFLRIDASNILDDGPHYCFVECNRTVPLDVNLAITLIGCNYTNVTAYIACDDNANNMTFAGGRTSINWPRCAGNTLQIGNDRVGFFRFQDTLVASASNHLRAVNTGWWINCQNWSFVGGDSLDGYKEGRVLTGDEYLALHPAGTDQSLDAGGMNEISAANAKFSFDAVIDSDCSGLIKVVGGGAALSVSIDNQHIDIAALIGRVNDHTQAPDTYKKISFPGATGVAPVADGTNYVHIHEDGNVDIHTTRQPMANHIYLGHFFSQGGYILEVFNVPEWVGHFHGRVNEWVSHAVGALIAEGLQITEQITPLQISLSVGEFYARLGEFGIDAPITTFKKLYMNGTAWVEDTNNPNQVNVTQYNDTALGLVAMTDAYYANHLFVLTPTGNLYFIYGQSQHATLDAAILGGLPVIPTAIEEDSVMPANVVLQKGDASIANRLRQDGRQDLKKIFGHGASPGSGVTVDHALTLNRNAADAHPISAITGLQAVLDALDQTSAPITPTAGMPSAPAIGDVQWYYTYDSGAGTYSVGILLPNGSTVPLFTGIQGDA